MFELIITLPDRLYRFRENVTLRGVRKITEKKNTSVRLDLWTGLESSF